MAYLVTEQSDTQPARTTTISHTDRQDRPTPRAKVLSRPSGFKRYVYGIVALTLAATVGCAARPGGHRTAASPVAHEQAPTASELPAGARVKPPAPADEEYSAPKASSVRGGAEKRARVAQARPEPRPGLGTAWGEDKYSPSSSTSFVRDTSDPFVVTKLWYNDWQGVNALRGHGAPARLGRGAIRVAGGMLSVELQDEYGEPIEHLSVAGRHYYIGRSGQAYSIVVYNHSPYRIECVASVDGLDVINGQTASFSNRGYLLEPYGQLTIEGFRRSRTQVAAFRFSSVRNSYSVKTGKGDRNIGVIGLAFFHEQGYQAEPVPQDTYLRRTADPFPGRYATPPSY